MEKQLYLHFRASDFLLDDDFLAWARGETPEANEAWEQWLAAHPSQRAEVEKAKLLFGAMSFKEKKIDDKTIQEEWEKVKAVSLDEPWELEEEEKRGAGRFWWKSAAAVLLLATLWGGKHYWAPAAKSTPALTHREVANGQQLTIKLMDGSVIKLNAGSTLSYPEKFPDDRREVRLKGEAYFEVAPNPRAPFIIHTDDVHIRVLGTKFAVEAYPEKEDVRVAVVEGKVEVGVTTGESEKDGEEVYLTRDEMVTFAKNRREMTVSGFDKNELLGWKDGILLFEKADFSEIVRRLERWYGVKIRIEGDVRISDDWRFSGKFENRPMEYILEVCRYPNRFTYEVTDKEIIIK